jgi:hypothetical protein
MATRSKIAIKNSDGTVESIYCHWDGYPEHNGAILVGNWINEKDIRQLIEMGDLSKLNLTIGEKHDFDDDVDQDAKWCKFYGRDRGETGTDKIVYPDIEKWLCDGEQYNYLFDNGEWRCFEGDEEIDLEHALEYKVSYQFVDGVLTEIHHYA